MLRITLLALCCALFSTVAEARGRVVCDNVDVMRPCQFEIPFSIKPSNPSQIHETRTIKRRARKQLIVNRSIIRHVRRYRNPSIGMAGVNPVLAAKVASIVGVCGSRVVSTVRHTYVAGTRRISQHANGTAVDITGNPACIYGQLHGWEGGYSVDYGAVRHVHISIGGREAGTRFVHGGHRRHYAHHRHHSHWARG
jgi:hypothetical protein